jgi:hypothetical protein
MNDRANHTTTYGPDNPHPLSRLKTELVWEGKYDEYGNRRPVKLPTSPCRSSVLRRSMSHTTARKRCSLASSMKRHGNKRPTATTSATC